MCSVVVTHFIWILMMHILQLAIIIIVTFQIVLFLLAFLIEGANQHVFMSFIFNLFVTLI